MRDTWPFVGLTITERFRRIAAGAGDHGDEVDGDDGDEVDGDEADGDKVDGDDGDGDDRDKDSFQVFEIHLTKPSSSSCGQWVKVLCHHDHHHDYHDDQVL